MPGQGRISCDPFFARSVPWYNAYAKKGHAVTNVRIRTCFTEEEECVADALAYEEDDLTLHESTGVLRYVAGKDAVVPSDAKKAARVDSAMATVLTKAGRLSSEITAPLFFVKDSKARVAKGIETVQPILQFYETLLSKQDYVAGDTLSLADFLFAPEVDQLLIVAPALQTQVLTGRVAIAAYLERMRQVDGYTAGFEVAKEYFAALRVPQKLSVVTAAVLERAHFVDAVDDELMCPICLRVVVSPLQCKEGHVFCKGCIETALHVKKECPMDRSALQVADLSRARTVENLVNKKKVRCPCAAQHTDEEDGCGWVGMVSERQKHIDTECGYTSVPCPHGGCEVRVQRRAVEEHAASCEQRVEACEHCGEGGVVSQRAQHEQVCPLAPVECPHAGCEAHGVRKDTAAHEAVCPMMRVDCAFKECGCAVGTLLRKDVAAHEKDAATHAALALAALSAASEREAALAATVAQLQSEAAEQAARAVAAEESAKELEAAASQMRQGNLVHAVAAHEAARREAALEGTVARRRLGDDQEAAALSATMERRMSALEATVALVNRVLQPGGHLDGPVRAVSGVVEWKVRIPRDVSTLELCSEDIDVHSDVESGSQTMCRLHFELHFRKKDVFICTCTSATDDGRTTKVCIDGTTFTFFKSHDAKGETVAVYAKDSFAAGRCLGYTIALPPAEFRNKYAARDGNMIVRAKLCATPVYAV